MKNYVRAKRLNVCGAPVFLHWSVLVVMGGCLAMAVSDPIVAIVAAAVAASVISGWSTGREVLRRAHYLYYQRQCLGWRLPAATVATSRRRPRFSVCCYRSI